jgi:RNA polymerase sigma factor (sigma-70 family)
MNTSKLPKKTPAMAAEPTIVEYFSKDFVLKEVESGKTDNKGKKIVYVKLDKQTNLKLLNNLLVLCKKEADSDDLKLLNNLRVLPQKGADPDDLKLVVNIILRVLSKKYADPHQLALDLVDEVEKDPKSPYRDNLVSYISHFCLKATKSFMFNYIRGREEFLLTNSSSISSRNDLSLETLFCVALPKLTAKKYTSSKQRHPIDLLLKTFDKYKSEKAQFHTYINSIVHNILSEEINKGDLELRRRYTPWRRLAMSGDTNSTKELEAGSRIVRHKYQLEELKTARLAYIKVSPRDSHSPTSAKWREPNQEEIKVSPRDSHSPTSAKWREPNQEEYKEITKCYNEQSNANITPGEMKEMLTICAEVLAESQSIGPKTSLDMQFSDKENNSYTLLDTVVDETQSWDTSIAEEWGPIISKIINTLEAQQKKIFKEYFLENQTYRTIGTSLDIDHTNVYRNVQKIRDTLILGISEHIVDFAKAEKVLDSCFQVFNSSLLAYNVYTTSLSVLNQGYISIAQYLDKDNLKEACKKAIKSREKAIKSRKKR